MNTNPLLSVWDTPYGLPPFDKIRPEHYAPAFEAAMAEHRAEVDAIAANPEPPTFQNTVAALDRAGQAFGRVAGVFYNLTASETSDALQAAERELMPRIAAHMSWLSLHEGVFRRVDALYGKRAELGLGAEELRLLERVRLDYVMEGALLEGAARARYAAIAEELAGLFTTFSQSVLGDEAAFRLELATEADRAGLPDFVLDAAKSVASEKGLDGYVINLSPSLVDPFLTYSTRRDLREKVWRAFKARGESCPERDTRPVAERIIRLRAELARLMGYETFADYALVDRMAKKPSAVDELLMRVWEPAKARALEEQKDLEAIAAREGFSGPLAGWDWHFYAEKLRQERYSLDEAELKPYFQLDRMTDAMFDAAGRLYGVGFKEVRGVPLYHPDARLYEVLDPAGGLVGVFIADSFARPTKRGGAWMSDFRSQSRNRPGGLLYPLVINNNNFAKASAGKPTLLSLDDLRTLFHEFGHGLHGLLSNVTYNRLSGTNVLRDFVELPSQINEHWALTPEMLKKHAVHAVTGKPIGDDLIALIKKSEHFNQGFLTVAYTSCALVDMSIHGLKDPEKLDLAAFEAAECARLGVPEAVGMRHRLPQFRHLFSDNGYAAGYYVYMWAEVLDADGFEAFEASGDAFNPELAAKFKRYVLSAGNTLDPAEAYRAFRGRDPDVKALLRGRGLV
ncbi:MAG: M3 family metallopeptidase [Spirochaetes bacterium]|nr:M3 family metallopeptidase [Spirochaetota bacterium]MBU1081928.1 M3 family metallopeptidase [Spirochaetota bacterium]